MESCRCRAGNLEEPDTGDLGLARQPRPQLCIPKQMEEGGREVQVQVQEELGEGKGKGNLAVTADGRVKVKPASVSPLQPHKVTSRNAC